MTIKEEFSYKGYYIVAGYIPNPLDYIFIYIWNSKYDSLMGNFDNGLINAFAIDPITKEILDSAELGAIVALQYFDNHNELDNDLIALAIKKLAISGEEKWTGKNTK